MASSVCAWIGARRLSLAKNCSASSRTSPLDEDSGNRIVEAADDDPLEACCGRELEAPCRGRESSRCRRDRGLLCRVFQSHTCCRSRVEVEVVVEGWGLFRAATWAGVVDVVEDVVPALGPFPPPSFLPLFPPDLVGHSD